jgi:hypothetical protein
VPESQRHVVPGARTGFGDGHGVQQTVARRHPVVDANVLGVHVEDRLAQRPDHCRNVRAHPHQVRRVEVCANDVAARGLNEAQHCRRAVHQLTSARLDRQFDAVVAAERGKFLPVLDRHLAPLVVKDLKVFRRPRRIEGRSEPEGGQ